MAHPDNEQGSEFEDRISDLEEIETELSNDKWISVKEYLPEIEKPVLVLRTNTNVVVSGYIHERGHWIWSNMKGSTHKADNFHKITHWRPFPNFDGVAQHSI